MDRSGRSGAVRLVFAVAMAVALAASIATAATAQSSPAKSYIVVLKPNVNSSQAASDASSRYGAQVSHIYRFALRGYSARMSESAAERVRGDSRVAYVVADGVMHADTTQSPTPSWGLDRIDQRSLPLSNSYTYTNTGSGVTAYIIDTGIRFSHNDFGGRAVSGVDEIDGGTADDCNGHGTHVSGTVGGSTYGVAKSVRLVAVRVLDCGGSGSTSGVIAGVDWVTGNHQAGQPAVANMSLGGGKNSALNTAVNNSINDGVSYAVAAGNGNILGFAANACNYSPSSVAAAMTVSATDQTDTKASWANYGSCVDWFAPGVNITSDWNSSDSATNTISGTSMATPHTAGVAALYLQSNPSASPASVRTALYNLTTKGIVKSSHSTANNHLLFTNL
ncbi:MAG TPA: S8 family serine peptidase [Actinomycetota bacterium]|nr:S8 family serine peptidase [Actinomycetota bacterium]